MCQAPDYHHFEITVFHKDLLRSYHAQHCIDTGRVQISSARPMDSGDSLPSGTNRQAHSGFQPWVTWSCQQHGLLGAEQVKN